MSITGAPASTQSVHYSYEPCRVRTGEYVNFHKQGCLLVRSQVLRENVQEPINRLDNLLARRGPIPCSAVLSLRQSTQEKLPYWLHVHMLHRVLPFHARFLPHVEPHFGTPYVAILPEHRYRARVEASRCQ